MRLVFSWPAISALVLPSSSFSYTLNTPVFFRNRAQQNNVECCHTFSLRQETIRFGSVKHDEDNAETESDIVDHAPCFDSVCTTSPWDEDDAEGGDRDGASESARGEAITRLGSMTGPTVWSEFNRLAQENPNVANLGQGFPDWLPPKFALDGLVEAAMDSAKSPHQYTRTAGHPKLVKELAKRYTIHLNRDHIDPMGEVAVTVGASQAIYMALQTIVQPGDEIILFEPFFDLYVNQIKLAGGTPVYVPLTFVPYDKNVDENSGGEWVLESEELLNSITPKTRAIILNSPHNPTGKVFTRNEMESISYAVETKASPNCVVLSDEVYKYIVHSPPIDEIMINANGSKTSSSSAISCPGHVHFASLPGMYDRTITISSAGKTFSATGWQVGWCIGPEHLIAPIHQLLPYIQFCASTVIQEALARTLPKADEPYEGHSNYYEYLKSTYTQKRDKLRSALIEAGFGITDFSVTPGGGFFLFARIGKDVVGSLPRNRVGVNNPAAPGGTTRQDWALCQWMAEEKGVICIPSSPFFSKERALEGASDEFVRIAFCKTDETIKKATKAFMTLKTVQKKPCVRKDDNSISNEVEDSMLSI